MAEEDGAWRRIENFERQPISRIFLKEATLAKRKEETGLITEDLETAILAAEKSEKADLAALGAVKATKITVSGKNSERLAVISDFRLAHPVTSQEIKKQILPMLSGVARQPVAARFEKMGISGRVRVFEREKILAFLHWAEFLNSDFKMLNPTLAVFQAQVDFALVLEFTFQGFKCVIAEDSRAPTETYLYRGTSDFEASGFYVLDHSTAKNAEDTLDAAFGKILLYLMSGEKEMIEKYAEKI